MQEGCDISYNFGLGSEFFLPFLRLTMKSSLTIQLQLGYDEGLIPRIILFYCYNQTYNNRYLIKTYNHCFEQESQKQLQYKMHLNAEEDAYDFKQDPKPLHKLDNLPFSKWHLFVIAALGLVWIFDGYEVTLISLYRNSIQSQASQTIFKTLVSAYQIGCILGSFLFGIMAFIIGRQKIFIITLCIYFFGVLLSGIRINNFFFIFARFLTGLSVGGQFTAIFTAIDEFMPPKFRGRVNIGIDGTWHLGGALASILTSIVGDTQEWRLMFLIGLFGIFSLFLMRKNVPESPRWLLAKNRQAEAIDIILSIQQATMTNQFYIKNKQFTSSLHYQEKRKPNSCTDYLKQILRLLSEALAVHTLKFIVSFTLIFTQAFFFNLVYYQFPDILANQFKLNQSEISTYMLPLAVMSFVSTFIIGPFFDKIGRRKLLLFTYVSSGSLLIVNYQIQNLFWRQIFIVFLFMFASPAGSSANLIASEVFPTASRTIMLFVMFIVSMLGGICGVWFDNYIISSLLMIFSGFFAFFFCPNSQNKSLQQIEKL